jgi:transposase
LTKVVDGKRLFFPHCPTEDCAQQKLLSILHRSPEVLGHRQSRWTLKALLQSCSWLKLRTEAGLWYLLKRLGIVRKQGRIALHSPDGDYDAKLAYLQACFEQAVSQPDRIVFLYLDEFSYYRQPTVACAYALRGKTQSRAPLSHRSNTRCRGIGALNALTGQVIYRQAEKITLSVQNKFYQDIRAAYPTAHRIYVVQDNWPNHSHPKVLASLETQESPFPMNVLPSWSTAQHPQAVNALPIQLIFLPTYAPWTNPIEKLWRWLRQTVLHLHRFSDAWTALKQRVLDFMATFAQGSQALLRYVGLLPD